jgi:hypothetical protein
MSGETGACGHGVVHFLWSGVYHLVAYIILSFVLDPMPEGAGGEGAPTSNDLLNAVDAQLAAGEKRLRKWTLCHVGYLYAAKPFSSAEER